jgi:hypothetical protein
MHAKVAQRENQILNTIEIALNEHHDKLQFVNKKDEDGETIVVHEMPAVIRENIKTITAIINLFVLVIRTTPELIDTDIEGGKPVIHLILSHICTILQYGSHKANEAVVNAFIGLHEVIGYKLMPMLPDDFHPFLNMCSAFDYITIESAQPLLVMLADYIYKHPGALDVYGDEFLETLCDLIDDGEGAELSQLASSMRETIFAIGER